jgi:Leucine-rich repeat (LRR) protein
MIKKVLLAIPFSFVLNSFISAQYIDTPLLSATELKNEKIYTDINDALHTPEKVIILDLSGQHLDSLPSNIAQFKNLQVLRLGYKIKKSTPKSILRQSKKTGGGIIHLDGLRGTYVDYNSLRELPAAIADLPKLQEINLSYNQLLQVPFILSQLKNLKWVNLVGCYALLDQTDDLKKLQSMLPTNCILSTDVMLD